MQTNKVSMTVVMNVWEAIDHLYAETHENITRTNVRNVLGRRVCRTSVFYAFEVLQEAGVLRRTAMGGADNTQPGRPADRFWVEWAYGWPSESWVEKRVTAYYERRGYVTS